MVDNVKFTIQGLLNLDVSKMIGPLRQAQQGLDKLTIPAGLNKRIEKAITQIQEFEVASKRTFNDPSEIKNANKAYDAMTKTIKSLSVEMGNLKLDNIKFKDKSLESGLKNATKYLSDFEKKGETTKSTFNSLFESLKKKINFSIKSDDLLAAAQAGETLGNKLQGMRNSLSAKMRVNIQGVEASKQEIEDLEKSLRSLQDAQKVARGEKNRILNAKSTPEKKQEATENYDRITEDVKRVNEELARARENQNRFVQEGKELAKTEQEIDQIATSYKELSTSAKNVDFSKIFKDIPELADRGEQSIDELRNTLMSLDGVSLEQVKDVLEQVRRGLEETGEVADKAGTELGGISKAGDDIMSTSNQVNMLKNNMLQFFSITNGWQIMRRVIKEAFETVKELDAAMTEIAVVSDYTLDQIWAMRNEYSSVASSMGASTLDLIDATKLYVQQGLNLQQSQEVAIETIKMARIANLDGAEATDLMTAAVRGYHMELSEANKVNDIYSELAAKTAADTQEIAIAMSKTASIAANAGAEFSNMSAFLAQIIETTRLLKAA